MIKWSAVELQTEPRNSSSRFVRPGTLAIFDAPLSFSTAWDIQSRLHHERLLQLRQDTVLILEHSPVYTLGRRTQPSDWLGNEQVLRTYGADLVHVNRGGSITFHGPGQIMVYPILKVAEYAAGPRRLVWLLEEVIIRLLKHWDISGQRIDKKPGVWVISPQPAKIAALGIRIEHGISLHGFALNVDMNLLPFQHIHPCGFANCLITSMKNVRNIDFPIGKIKLDLARIFSEVFEIEWTTVTENPFDQVAADSWPARDTPFPL